MLRLTQAPDIATAMLWSDLLCEAGMPASVQRQHLGAAAGHLPPGECLPEIWLAHAEHADPARALLRDYERLPQRQCVCRACGESIEGGVDLGTRSSFCDLSATIATLLSIDGPRCGESFADLLKID